MARSLSLALVALALCGAVPAFAGEAYPDLDLFIVDPSIVAEYDAAALDGSPPAYYFTKASDPALASTWVLYFKGGGWSYDEVESYERSKGELGSSKNLAKTFKFEAGPSSPIPEYNSLAGANRVVLWYLDGMSFAGNREGDVPVPGTNETIRCRGFANLQAILKELDTMHGLSDASKVLVSGGSAGGLAAYLHSQYISDRYSRATVAAAPASGFFLDRQNAAGDYVYPMQIKYAMTFQNATGGVNQRCVSAMPSGDEWKCGMAQFSWAHTEVPTFIMNCPWDSWQLKCEFTTVLDPQTNDPARASCNGLPGYEACGKDYNQCNSTQMGQFNDYASSMLGTMKSTPKFSQPGNGAFLHSCVSHVASQGTTFTSIKVDGVSFKEAFDAWWGAVAAGKPAPAEEHTHLPCTLHTEHPYACNPTC